MLKISTIKKTFVRQTHEDDCGLACLAMILNYAEKRELAKSLKANSLTAGAFSLLDLKNTALECGLIARCVELDIGFLRSITTPCILHTVNEMGLDHFEVCYGSSKKGNHFKYLVADPATQVHFIAERDLEKKWQTRATLWFDGLSPDLKNFGISPSRVLIDTRFYPVGMLIVLPFLSVSIAAFGITLTWLLQRGLSNSELLKGNILNSLTVLLLIISVFKSVFTFLRQYILININLSVNEKLSQSLASHLNSNSTNLGGRAEFLARIWLVSIQKIQNSVSAFLGVIVSDGSILLLLLSGVFYLLPFAGLVLSALLLILGIHIFKSFPESSYNQSRLQQLSGASERSLIKQIQKVDLDFTSFKNLHCKNLDVARKLAVKISKLHLLYECTGTLAVVIVFALAARQLNKGELDYNSFMLVVIEAYLIVALIPKIYSSAQQVAEGIEGAVQLQNQ
ncbi:cysteine peptidase family C39 domain-containing protein [Mucilaginibacter sp. cycad4]|uniref:cysteine peptidase family C39 domain-containing protein n=1 Tax=Mucilaginibacter sp. cycad4 TaxID=3342096 RepID=UPI002AAAD1FC|nr:cysteine peptidase family C39 domain-containing protein [Mucilaginibacter gossypii]WPU99086.1 cysteine peptidase family C39 domain-containing protein [Mucilaginibacter gossypii]